MPCPYYAMPYHAMPWFFWAWNILDYPFSCILLMDKQFPHSCHLHTYHMKPFSQRLHTNDDDSPSDILESWPFHSILEDDSSIYCDETESSKTLDCLPFTHFTSMVVGAIARNMILSIVYDTQYTSQQMSKYKNDPTYLLHRMLMFMWIIFSSNSFRCTQYTHGYYVPIQVEWNSELGPLLILYLLRNHCSKKLFFPIQKCGRTPEHISKSI